MLVVGGGNTGYQVAEELSATHEVHLSVGSRHKPLPQRLLGRDIFRWRDAVGALTKTADSRLGRRMKASDTLVGSSPRRARRKDILLHPRTTAASGSTVAFADARDVEVATVIWATGFARDHSRGSALLGWVKEDAAYIAEQI